jgi:hypothetical protein
MSSRKQVQQCWCRRANLFDHLVGAGDQVVGNQVFVWFMILAFYATLAAPHVHAVWVALQ